VKPNRFQPREHFGEEALAALAERGFVLRGGT
jgi:hypothetical protein